MSSDSCRKVSRGQVWFLVDNDVPLVHTQGSIQGKNRPWLVVSNNKCNQSSPVYTVVPLTTSPKSDLPTHVTFQTGDKTQTIMCEQIRSVSQQAFFNSGSYYKWTMSEKYMRMVDEALAVQLGLSLIFPKSEQFWDSLERLIRTRVKEAINDSKVQAIDISMIASLLDAKVEDAIKEETKPAEPVVEPEPAAKTEIRSGSKPWHEMPQSKSNTKPEEPKVTEPAKHRTRPKQRSNAEKQAFVNYVNTYGTKAASQHYDLKLGSVYTLKLKYQKELSEENSNP